ncbi:MAG: M42 family metallopeptidase [Candidatus Sumerlaeaceae bacterium]
MSESISILRELCDAHGVTGYEEDVRALVQNRIAPLVDELKTDALGNLIAFKRAPEPNAPTLLMDAHLDEIGLIISYIEPSGFLRFVTVGGWDERVLPAHAVDLRTIEGRRIRGVIGVPPPHIQKSDEKNKPYPIDSLFIDVGARCGQEVEDLGIRVGDSAVPFYPFLECSNGVVIGKALDDRAGCTVLIQTLQTLFGNEAIGEAPRVNIAAAFTTFEETGARGAAVAAHGIDPQLAIVLEGTVAGDFPGVPPARNPSRQGAGPVLTLVDRTAHFPRRFVQFLQNLADKHSIPHQLKTPVFGGTNAARIQITRSGVPTGVISVPCRYIHSPHATLRVEDLEHTLALTVAFARECHALL